MMRLSAIAMWTHGRLLRADAAGADVSGADVEVTGVAIDTRTVAPVGATDPATGSVTYVRKSLGLKQLPPGTYIVEVTVEYAGTKAVRRRQVLIVPRP